MKSDDVKLGLMLAAVAAVAYVAWKGYKAAGAVGDALSNAGAAIAQSWESFKGTMDETFVQPFNQGQAWVDAGQPINTDRITPSLSGPWMSDPVAAAYEAGMARPPQAVSDSGAAFGIYPSAGRRKTATAPVYASTALSTYEAQQARSAFAATDPRRLDL